MADISKIKLPNGTTYNLVGTDTKNTAGSTNNTGKLFLVGALEQSANPQTYSNSNVFIRDNILEIYAYDDGDIPGISIKQSNGAPAVQICGTDISSSLLMFSRENDDPSSMLHNTIYLNATGASGTLIVNGNDTYVGLIGEEGRVRCDKMSYTNETVTFSKSSGSWTFNNGEYTRSGQVVQIRIAFKGGGSNVSVGSNAIAGTINGIPTPPYTVRLQGYYSGTVLMGELTTSGGFNVRILGQALNLSSSNTATLSGTYVVED